METPRPASARQARNVLGGELELCSMLPLTGFFRNGCCDTSREDFGSHTVCVRLTAEFLAYSRSRGNDLTTPRPEYDFPGLKPGDSWCLCASRWQEALEADCAPQVVLESTNQAALEILSLSDLQQHAVK